MQLVHPFDKLVLWSEMRLDGWKAMKILSRLRDAINQQDCRLCGGTATRPICAACDDDLARLPAARCPVCALPSHANQPCGRCLSSPPAYDSTHATLEYAFPITRLIQAFKYEHAVGLAATLANYLDEAAAPTADWQLDLLLPMPLARARLAERGYNQALELARVLVRHRRLALGVGAVTRVRHGPPQADLPWRERSRNIRGAFTAQRRFDGLTVCVIDDVMTTGATLDEMARVLKAAGARRVVNWVVARTLPRPEAHLP